MKFSEFCYNEHDGRKIIIYGTNDMTYVTSYCLDKLGIPVYCYANRKGTSSSLYPNTISLEEMAQIYRKENIIILFAVYNMVLSETQYLEMAGIDEVYSVRRLLEKVPFKKSSVGNYYINAYNERDSIFFFEDMIMHPEEIYIPTIDVVVTERCSLRCKDCSNLMQYYDKPKNMDVDILLDTVDKILDRVDRLCDLRILGGEPFMNMDFIKILDRYINESKISIISIWSNATIFPQEEILEHLKHPKVFIRMSDYGNLSGKLHTWTDWCEANDVRYSVSKMDLWQQCGKLERHDYNKYELMDVYANCECRNLPTIIKNKLYGCPYAANAANLGAMYKEESEKDCLIMGDNITGTDIDHFLYNREYFEGCRYCQGRNFKRARTIPNVQTKIPLTYERLDDRSANTQIDIPPVIVKDERLLSVVIPVYNAEKYVERCLHSVLNQTYQCLEIIIVDDGSTDASVAICDGIAENDLVKRVHVIRNEHAGVVEARNTGIKSATGELIAFVDADDYLEIDYLEKMMAQIDDADMVCSGFIWVEEEKVILDETMDRGQGHKRIVSGGMKPGIYAGEQMKALWKHMFNENMMKGYVWAKIYKTSILQQVCDGVDRHIFILEDNVLFFLYMAKCNKVKFIEEYGYYYNFRNHDFKYPWEKMAYNIEAVYNSCKQAFLGHSQETLLMECLEEYYKEMTIMGLNLRFPLKVNGKNYYYPYFGRLIGKRVILYGAGNVGKCYYKHIREDAECVLAAWVDKNAEYLQKNELLPVEKIEYIQKYEFDVIIVAVFDKEIYMSIRNELIPQGISEEKIVWNPTKVIF